MIEISINSPSFNMYFDYDFVTNIDYDFWLYNKFK